MQTHISRWIARALALCVLGPLCSRLAMGVRGKDGSEHATFLISEHPMSGAMLLLTILLITIAAGVGIARVTNRREALLNMAFILGWVAWTSGRLGEVFRVFQGGFIQLAIESALIGGAMAIVLLITAKNAKDEDEATAFEPSSVLAGPRLLALGASVIAALAVVWAFGQTDLPGQSLWAAFAGGVAAGLVGAMIQHSGGESKEKKQDASMIPMLLGVLLAGVLAPLVGMLMPGSSKLLVSISSGSLPGWLVVTPISWAVGALIGVPVGWGWLESSVSMQSSTQTASSR